MYTLKMYNLDDLSFRKDRKTVTSIDAEIEYMTLCTPYDVTRMPELDYLGGVAYKQWNPAPSTLNADDKGHGWIIVFAEVQ